VLNVTNRVNRLHDQKHVVVPSEEYPLVAPELYQPVDSGKVLPEVVRSNEIVLHEIFNATVWFDGEKSKIVNSDGETIYNYGNQTLDPTGLSQPVCLNGTTLLLGVHGAHNYYHWNVDVLPKLKVLELAGHAVENVDHIVLRNFNRRFHSGSFSCLGLAEDKLYLTENSPFFKCERLLHIDLRNFVGMRMHRMVPEFLRSVFLRSSELPGGRKLFVARESSHDRPIVNQQDTLELVTQYGFEIVFLEELSLPEQAVLFNSACVIVSTHGAGLTNLVYCNPGTTVVEIFGAHVYPYFFGLSNLCGLRYIPVIRHADDFPGVFDPHVCNEKKDQAETVRASTHVNLSVLNTVLNSL